jgi:hypothetical protein
MTTIFPHIPKCAGTSIGTQLNRLPIDVFLDYAAPPTHGGHGKQINDARKEEFRQRHFSEFNLVFGHFPVDRNVSDKYRYVAMSRDSFSRLVSHVSFLVERYKPGVALAHHAKSCSMKLESGEMSIQNYVNLTQLYGVYKMYFCR